MTHTRRHTILVELNRLRRKVVLTEEEQEFQTDQAVVAFKEGKDGMVFVDDSLTRPFTPGTVDTLIRETVDVIMASAMTPQGAYIRDLVTTQVENLLLSDGSTVDADLGGAAVDVDSREFNKLLDRFEDLSFIIQDTVDARTENLRTFPDVPTNALRLRRIVLSLWEKETLDPGSTGMTMARKDAILDPSSASLAESTEAKEFLDELDVEAFYQIAAGGRGSVDASGEYEDSPQDVGVALNRVINSFDDDAVASGQTVIPTTYLDEYVEPERSEGFQRLVDMSTPPKDGRLPSGAAANLVDAALAQAGVKLSAASYTQDTAGKQQHATVLLARDMIVDRVQTQIDIGGGFPEDLAKFVQNESAVWYSGTFEEASTALIEGKAVDDAAAIAATLKSANENPDAGLKLLKSLMYQANRSSSPSDLLPEDYDALLETVLAGGGVKPVEGDFPDTESFERATDEYNAFVSDVESATERFNTSEQAKKDAKAAKTQTERDTAASLLAISDGEILRALETAGFGNVGDTGEYQQLLESLIPEIRDNLQNIRNEDPTAELDVVALLQGDKAFSVAGKAGTDGILAGIEGFQSEEEFDAEELRMDETILPTPPMAETGTIDREFLDEQNILSTPISSTPFLPPGVPGLPTLADTGVISSSALDAQREKALQLDVPDFGEIEDLVAKLSGGNPELQEFILENLDLDAIKKSGRDEAARRRQEAFDDAARLSETPKPFEMPDIDPSRLPAGSMDRLRKQKEQRSKKPVLTGAQSARYADRALPKVDFGGLVRDELPELTRRFKESPDQVAIRQREIQADEQEKKREAKAEDARRESRALRRGRTVFRRG